MHKKRTLSIMAAALATILFTAGCTKEREAAPSKKEGKLDIYTTVYPLQFFTERIGGDHVHVSTIYPPGADEHTYEPSQKDMMSLADADMFFYIGLGLEGFVSKAENVLNGQHVKLVATAEGLPLEASEGHEGHDQEDHAEGHHEEKHEDEARHAHDHGGVDPHVWLDPVYSKELANVILDKLKVMDPKHGGEYEKNYKVLAKQLDELDTRFKEVGSQSKRKQIVVAHAAYGYWENRYGIEQIPISGLSTTDEPSQRKLKEVADLIKKEDIPFILFEQNVQSKLADVIRKETGAKALHIHNLSVLTEKELKDKENYFTLMDKNIEVLDEALN